VIGALTLMLPVLALALSLSRDGAQDLASLHPSSMPLAYPRLVPLSSVRDVGTDEAGGVPWVGLGILPGAAHLPLARIRAVPHPDKRPR
jgi:hypothetical protein